MSPPRRGSLLNVFLVPHLHQQLPQWQFSALKFKFVDDNRAMTHSKIEDALNAAFKHCEAALCPLSDRQKSLLLQVVEEMMRSHSIESGEPTIQEAIELAGCAQTANPGASNPLDELTPAERDALLEFVQQQDRQNCPWKMTLLNDWLQGRDSGPVQFIRERYGVQWLEQIQPSHLAHYSSGRDEVLKLKVGDRIEVTNGLWEWVQESGPCSREWFPCTVIGVQETSPEDANSMEPPYQTACIVRFDTGSEFEIQGVYDWNRPYWRWLQQQGN